MKPFGGIGGIVYFEVLRIGQVSYLGCRVDHDFGEDDLIGVNRSSTFGDA